MQQEFLCPVYDLSCHPMKQFCPQWQKSLCFIDNSCPSNNPLGGRKVWITLCPWEGKKWFPDGEALENTGCCLFLLHPNLHAGCLALVFMQPQGSFLFTVDPPDPDQERWQPLMHPYSTRGPQSRVFQLVLAGGCRLLGEAPWVNGCWSLSMLSRGLAGANSTSWREIYNRRGARKWENCTTTAILYHSNHSAKQ